MIELEGIERRFHVGDQTVHALRDVHFSLPAGAYVSVMGPSGSGKSTLLNILGLLDRPDAGRYRFDGEETTTAGEERRAALRRERVGFVFQAFHLVPRLTAAENIELPMTLAGIDPQDRKQRVADVLDAMDLAERASHRPDELSGGQRQRVAIGRAIAMRPALLLADEPTGNLDKHSGTEVVTELERLNDAGLTLVVVTHDPDLGRRAHRLVRMDDGRIASDSGEG